MVQNRVTNGVELLLMDESEEGAILNESITHSDVRGNVISP